MKKNGCKIKKEIGGGWQYRAFLCESGEVLKVPHSFLSQFKKITTVRANHQGTWNLFSVLKEMIGSQSKSFYSLYVIRKKLNNDQVPGDILACPRFVSQRVYFQEEVETLWDWLKRSGEREALELIDKIPNFIFTMWNHRFSDGSFEVLFNIGVRGNGQLSLIDYGELVFDHHKLEGMVRNKKWLISWSYRSLKDEKIKEYYRKVMEERVTSENLRKEWGRR